MRASASHRFSLPIERTDLATTVPEAAEHAYGKAEFVAWGLSFRRVGNEYEVIYHATGRGRLRKTRCTP